MLIVENINISCVKPAKCAVEGETIHVPCTFTGKPQPNVSVTKIDGPSGKEAVLNQIGLTFEMISLDSRGTYLLQGVNTLETKNFSLNFTVGENICVPPETVKADVDDTGYCSTGAVAIYEAKGAPPPTINWTIISSSFFGTTVLGIPVTVKNSDDTFTVSRNFTIEDTQYNHSFVEFEAEAGSGFPPSAKMLLKVNKTCSRPDAPEVKVIKLTNESIEVNIAEAENDGGSEVVQFMIAVSHQSILSQYFNVSTKAGMGAQRNVLIEPLDPYTEYNLAVAAMNNIGQSPFSNVTQRTHDRPGPTDISDATSECDKVDIDYRKADDRGGLITSYIIRYKVANTASAFLSLPDFDGDLSENITGLRQETTYEIHIVSRNEYGTSIQSAIRKATTTKCLESFPIWVVVVIAVVIVVVVLLILLLAFFLRRGWSSWKVPSSSSTKAASQVMRANQDSARERGDHLAETGRQKELEMQPSRIYEVSRAKKSLESSVPEYEQIS